MKREASRKIYGSVAPMVGDTQQRLAPPSMRQRSRTADGEFRSRRAFALCISGIMLSFAKWLMRRSGRIRQRLNRPMRNEM